MAGQQDNPLTNQQYEQKSHHLSRRQSLVTKASRMQPITMAQIAKKLQVDQSTVSLALRNSPRLSAATKDRIQKTAAALGYKPNPFVSALMRMRRGRAKNPGIPVVAWISNWDRADSWMQVPYFKAVYHGAADRLSENGFRLEHFWLDPKSNTPARLSSILWNRGITGMILAPVPNNRPDAGMDWEKFSALTIGRSIHSPDLDRVDSAHYDAITVALKRCQELGYERIGLAIDDVSLARFDQRFLASYLVNSPLLKSGKHLEIFRTPVETKAGIKAFQAWFRSERPDVIITLSKQTAVTHRTALKDIKAKVPEDVGLVVLSCHSADDPFSGIYQFPELIGGQAADLLVRKILRNECGIPKHPLTFTINGIWNPGTTTRAANPNPDFARE
jgi:DNA-binding LacI/PurR family transcriptional regulator